jgi:carboxyl-terminal processing protease
MNKVRVLLLGVTVLVSFSCKKLTEVFPKETEVVTTPNPNAEVNAWIYEQLKTYYLWESQMKTEASSNKLLAPAVYFDSLLVKPGVLDRFSWIQDDVTALTNSLNGVNKVLGVRFTPFYANNAQTKVALSIAYAIKGSPADLAGIKRGDFITKVNGVELTIDNYSTALNNDNLKLTLGNYVNGEVVSGTTELNVTKAEVQTDPIQYSTVLTVGTKKVGYLVYTQFLTQYDNAIRAVFKEFKDKGVNELVLDLRYNGGGYISSSNIISSLIVKNLKPGTLMSSQEWNTALTKAYKAQYGQNVFDTNWLNEPNNLGTLNRVYILTSRGTASASELIINNLKPFMDVILVGDNTYGKNVGSITLSDDKKRWAWGMQPIVLKTTNALGQSDYGTVDGFTPTIKVEDRTIPFKPFGDPNETLLKAALGHMNGNTMASVPNAKISAAKQVNVLSRTSILDNPKTEINDMWIDKLPGHK